MAVTVNKPVSFAPNVSKPLELMIVPALVLPVTAQATLISALPVAVTSAVNCWVWPCVRVAALGEMMILVTSGFMV